MDSAKNIKFVSDMHFGTIAIEKGFLTPGQFGTALSIQMRQDLEGSIHRLIGEVLINLGFMNIGQVNEVIEVISQMIQENTIHACMHTDLSDLVVERAIN